MCLVTYPEVFRKCEVSEELSWVCGKSASLGVTAKKPVKWGQFVSSVAAGDMF